MTDKTSHFIIILMAMIFIGVLVGCVSYSAGKRAGMGEPRGPSTGIHTPPQNSESSKPAPTQAASEGSAVATAPLEQNGEYIGLIKNIAVTGNPQLLTIDFVQWNPCTPDAAGNSCMNGYEVINANPRLRAYHVDTDATVLLQTYRHTAQGSYDWNTRVTVQDFARLIANPPAMYPAQNLLYWITLKDGEIIKIVEQYQP